MMEQTPRLLFAAPASGSGKTTVTCAVLRALIRRGLRVASFKCGPDYIDPMFHRESVGTRYSANLDLFLGDADCARQSFSAGAQTAEIAVIEGVMGYYDGLAGTSEQASSYALAQELGAPVVLVVNCRGASLSIAAQVKGFTDFRPDANIQAVILNQLPPILYPDLKRTIEMECGVLTAGYLPPMPSPVFESRQLGLVPAAEVEALSEKLDALAAQAEQTLDLDRLLRIARAAPPFAVRKPPELPARVENARIAVARDEAFCFYYADSLALLERLGATLIPFSPLRDATLPPEIGGLLLGGGYPELHTRALCENATMRDAVRDAVAAGMPTIAECGGFLYLGKTLADADGAVWQMAGVLDAHGERTDKRRRFGYATLTAKRDNLLCPAGATLAVHEFHRWDSTDPGDGFTAQKPLRDTAWDCVFATESLYAGFPHLYLAGNPTAAARFVRAVAAYRKD